MSLKFIFLPAAIVFSAVLGIFVIYPVYTSITDPIMGTSTILQKKESELAQKQQQQENGIKMIEQVKGETEGVERLLERIPRLSGEERVVAMVDYAARTSGISLTDMSVSGDSGGETTLPQVAQESAFPVGSVDPTTGMMLEGMPVQTLPVQSVSVAFSVLGTYEGFKAFVNEVNSLSRRHVMKDLQISKNQEEEQNSFEMSGTISFEYAPSQKIEIGVISPVLSQESFDFSLLDNVKGSQYRDLSEPLAAQRANPFLP